MDAADFRVLYAYNAWANQRTLSVCAPLTPDQFLRDMKSSFASVRDTLAHIFGAEFVWLERWAGRPPVALPVASQFPDFASVREGLTLMDNQLIAYVSTLGPGDCSRTIEYRQISGKQQSGPLAPMLQHLVNHGTYHRGQVATLLRQLHVSAVSTDLIAYHRELAAQASV